MNTAPDTFAPTTKRNDVDSIYEQMSNDMANSPTIKKSKFVLKVGGKYAAKNEPLQIQKGKPRYVIQDNAYYFNSQVQLMECKRVMEAGKNKCVVEEIF